MKAIQPMVHKISHPQAFWAAMLEKGPLRLGAKKQAYRSYQ